jgi:nitrogen regulatory protein P-II 1
MKLITAVIQPHALEDVMDALRAHGHHGVTVTEVVGSGSQGGHPEVYRGIEYRIDTIPKLKLELLVDDADESSAIGWIVGAARTGTIGDGKVWSTDVSTVVRVRTGETGVAAI